MAKRHNIDAVHRYTSKQLTHLEKAIRRLYRKAATNAASVGAHYFNQYRTEWNAKLKQLKDGDITTTEWIQWATDTVFYGEDFARVSDELIALLSHTDADALALIDQIRTDVFVHAHNYTAYMIERTFYDTAFTLVDAHTLGVLQSTAHPLLPVLTQNRKKYTQWMRQRIRNEVTAGITQGESIDKMAKRLANAANMSKSASVRTARTACTCAENTGRRCRSNGSAPSTSARVRRTRRWTARRSDTTRSSPTACGSPATHRANPVRCTTAGARW